MIPDLKEYIEEYRKLQEVKKQLEILDDKRLEQQRLLDALMPWIREKEEILRDGSNFFQKVFGLRGPELEQVRDEHHRMTLRAQTLEQKIDLIDYEQEVLRQQLVFIPSVVYKVDRMVEDTDLETLDQETRKIFEGIRQCNEYIRQNKDIKKQVMESIATGDEVIGQLSLLIQKLRISSGHSGFDPIQGITNNNFFSVPVHRRQALELIPRLCSSIKKWDAQIAAIAFHPKPEEKLYQTVHESYQGSIVNNIVSGYMTDRELYAILKRLNDYKKDLLDTLKHLEEEKQSFDQRKHELLLGQSIKAGVIDSKD